MTTTKTGKISEATRKQALKALDGMREIVRAEMLIRGEYVEEGISNPARANSLCGGRRHCAVGSLWTGAGVKLRKKGPFVCLPGVNQHERGDFLLKRHGLRTAYIALNSAAKKFAEKHHIRLDHSSFAAPIEALFEGNYGNHAFEKRELLQVIAAAKREVRSM